MASKQLPRTIRKMIATKRSPKFREVVSVVDSPLPTPGDGEVLVKNRFVGINASDVNFTAGRYDPSAKFPVDCGFEGLGVVAGVGQGVKSYSVGQPVMYVSYGAFSEYKTVNSKVLIPIPALKPEFLPFMISGTTAAISLDKVGEIKEGETVLITAAAGGTGQIAVQWAKNAGCHVIGTCSSDQKVDFLKSIGCHRPINYNKENIKEVLKTEYKNGVDVVYETIGGEMFDTCLNALAVGGRLIVIGFIEGYHSDAGFLPSRTMATLPVRLLNKSCSVRGFFLNHYFKNFPEYITKLAGLYTQGQLQSFIDMGDNSSQGRFAGVDSIYRAVEHLYSKKSIGKIVVELNKSEGSKL